MKNIIIIGGGRVGNRLIIRLRKNSDYNITIVDSNQQRLEQMKKYSDVEIVKGNATNKKVLLKAGIENADIVVAATSTDEVNLLISVIAQECGVEKVVARTENPSHIKMFKKLGLNEVVSPELATCMDIQRRIIRPNTIELPTKGKEDYEIINIPIISKRLIGKKIGEISPAENFIIIQYYQRETDRELIATNDIVLQKGDIATILLKKSDFKKVKKFFNKTGLIGFI
ncbi:MAG: TrkA family potassium uptake protein [Methanosphaera sp.]|uniref:potassium channel family protein n=1 Tax=Methanosphaera sp. TaxID=2666342 RepID=UPI0025CDA125|nr:TrkA family potassium uptake protein [Methanosphaera sp.]MCI5866805.1 TrkA family potassium uptake protein [Methanosphaera sp.]MDD6534319.1 TrkA family potassium uptake protein [Methanosphaera sp.]MDY3956296.1 TrkA family potassium uptake protein [Methanosphaera sp.]